MVEAKDVDFWGLVGRGARRPAGFLSSVGRVYRRG
jgi:hypothetical protein